MDTKHDSNSSDGYIQISEGRIAELTELAKQWGARIYIVRAIQIQLDGEWCGVIKEIFPSTPAYFHVLKSEVGAQYPSTSGPDCLITKDIVLLNFQKDGGLRKAVAWARAARLSPSVPREIFALGKNLVSIVASMPNVKAINIIAPIRCSLGGNSCVCCVSFEDATSRAALARVSSCDGPFNWFSLS